uniref:NADH dehydrogenase subunit 6 n=1 Tax=Galba pervia TaxID=1051332 RepID=J3R5Y2_9GAST|nr:NADH dehydrogenase subunit 6 [Galba pervia]AEO51224.1 NADH dehydrogenase subunit 6 [Galba pervia]
MVCNYSVDIYSFNQLFLFLRLLSDVFLLEYSLFQLSPVSLAGLLIFISVSFVILINLLSSAWYGYLLFLIYIGGLLVLFIYMCMISSNTMFKVEMSQMVLLLTLLSFYFSFMFSELNYVFLGNSASDSGITIKMSVFLSLVSILLVMFLAIVQIIKLKSSLQI